jgi:hypothetical protein
MRSTIPTLVLLAGLPARALAAPTADASPACSYIEPQVKQCAVAATGGVGTFDVTVAPPASLVVAFDEAVIGMLPPPTTSYRTSFSGTTATVVPIRRDPIRGATVHIDTATVHVALNLRLGPVADTQLVIVDPRKGRREEEVERRVREGLASLDERASQRADELMVSELATDGLAITDADAAPARHNQVVLRAKELVRLGCRRVLVLAIENRSADPLSLKRIRVWAERAGTERELPNPIFSLRAGPSLPVNQEAAAAVSLAKACAAGDRLRVRVEFTDPERTVELADIRVR